MPSPRDSHSSLREPKGVEWNIQAQKTPSQEGVIVDYENEWEHPKQGTGAAGRTRTPDPCITNALLYRLSYCGPILRRTILKVRCVVKAPMAGRGLYTSTRG